MISEEHLLNKANELIENKKYDDAYKCYKEIEEIYKNNKELNSVKSAELYNNMSLLLYFYKNQVDIALEYCTKAKLILEKAYGENHVNVAYTYNIIGLIYEEKEDYDKALKYREKAKYLVKSSIMENNN